MFTVSMIAARALVALLFILAGVAKITAPDPVIANMAAHGVPGLLLPLVIALEIGAGVALLVGWRIEYAAGALAIFCVAAALLFHLKLSIPAERTLFFKDLALAGGLLAMALTALRARTASR